MKSNIIPLIRVGLSAKLAEGALAKVQPGMLYAELNRANQTLTVPLYQLESLLKLLGAKIASEQKVVEVTLKPGAKKRVVFETPNVKLLSDNGAIDDDLKAGLDKLCRRHTFSELLCLPGPTVAEPGQPGAIADLLKSKSNDYSAYEELVNLFIKHSLAETDFAEGYKVSLHQPLTIVIPSHNTSETLRTSLECIDKQYGMESFGPNVTINIVDDASDSPVDKARLVAGLKNLRNINIIRSANNIYIGRARNLGYVNIESGLVLSMDADVALERTYLVNHIARHSLYQNLITTSNRQNVPVDKWHRLAESDKEFKVDITKDSRWHADYPADYLGGPGHAFSVDPIKQTSNFKQYGFAHEVASGIPLRMMVKGHNFFTTHELLRQSDYCGRMFVKWGDDDAYLASKLIAIGAIVVPVLSTGILHPQHPPRLSSTDDQKFKQLERNVKLRRRVLKSAMHRHIH